jgi:hypothetical protein
VGEQVDVSQPGFHELPAPPISERSRYVGGRPVEVWTGSEVIVWGGASAESASDPGRSLGDGASFNPEEGRWRPLPPSPFVDGLYRPMGAWDGSELIVIGTWCDAEIPPVTDGSPPPCPKGPAAAAYDPEAGTWRRLDPPPIPVDSWSGERVVAVGPEPVAVGGDGAARFAFGWHAEAISWDRDDGWTAVGPAVQGEENVALCADVVDGALAAVVLPQLGADRPSMVRTVGPGDRAWGSAIDLGPMEADLSCGAGLAAGARSDDPAVRGHGYDLATGEAVPLVDPPASIGYSRPYALGPWIVLDDSQMGEEVDGSYLRRYRVRRASDGPNDWVEVVAPLDESIDPADAVPLDGIGLLKTSPAANGDYRVMLWRRPDSLTA